MWPMIKKGGEAQNRVTVRRDKIKREEKDTMDQITARWDYTKKRTPATRLCSPEKGDKGTKKDASNILNNFASDEKNIEKERRRRRKNGTSDLL